MPTLVPRAASGRCRFESLRELLDIFEKLRLQMLLIVSTADDEK
jgi:hypothetical protein